jgi:hypothetical protein
MLANTIQADFEAQKESGQWLTARSSLVPKLAL